MARTPRVPRELTNRPFSLKEAKAAGLTLSALKSKAWRRLGSELYCRNDLQRDSWVLLAAWQRQLPAGVVFGGATAAWLAGLDLDPVNPIEVVASPRSGLKPRAGLSVRRCHISSKEVVEVRGLRATSLHRTLADLCVLRPAVEALVAVDMAVHAGLSNTNALDRYCDSIRGRAGARRLRGLAALAAPAESPMETRLRWTLIQAGLPSPHVQVDLRDADGRFVGRADLYYPRACLAIEYDGENHRDRLVEDNRRQNSIANAGFHLLRFTAADVYRRPDAVAAQVRHALDAQLDSNGRNSGLRSPRLSPNGRNG